MYRRIKISLLNVCGKISHRTFVFAAIGVTVILCVYYASYTSNFNRTNRVSSADDDVERDLRRLKYGISDSNKYGMCPNLVPAAADIDTVEVFKNFDFQPAWMKNKEYWDKSFEDRYERQKIDPARPPLKVIIVPHSHNDPGWLNTFEHYFHYQSRQIINHMVVKLQQYKNLTFIWSEVAFLSAWWDEAHPSKQRALKSLIQSGRLEITTGGWVMPDEANTHVYAMVDQLIEGHQWLWTNLGIKPKSGWSIDPFGHGSTQPYILAECGFKGTVIQRIHYAWKQWLAVRQYGDFFWVPSWSPSSSSSKILTHNQPFDIYSIKHSCGPHPYICLNFDFRKVAGEYTEYSVKSQTITDKNVKDKSELLLEQYARTGSLFPHNVVLMPLGDDFRYNVAEEFDQQYTNYIKLIDYINSNNAKYKSEISFGTPLDYFAEISKRSTKLPSLKGDFFVYSDIFSEGRPAYWSGYFTTRPFMKILDRELENSLRSAEILYTIALNNARQRKLPQHLKILERDFEKLVRSRRNLGLFQHHDAITGTSKSFVMRDYGLKLFEGIRDTASIQQNALQTLFFPSIPFKPGYSLILSDLERESYEKLPRKTVISISSEQPRKIILYNSLAHVQEQLVQIRTASSNVKVLDNDGKEIIYQINPVWNVSASSTKFGISTEEFEVIFIAKVPQLSLVMYELIYDTNVEDKLAVIYCSKCTKTETSSDPSHVASDESNDIKTKFHVKSIPVGDIQLENHKVKLLFSGNTGFMKTITRKHNPKVMQCGIHFAAYRSAQFHSGAYLFMPDPNEHEIEKDVLLQYKDELNIFITSGPVASELTVIYGSFLVHTVQIYHIENSSLADGIYIENTVDFEKPPKNRETELFMRIISNIQNGDPPVFYSDLNGFQMQKRVKVERINVEGNYYPITTVAYIQDENVRLSLLTNHAQGAASWQPGYLEVMLDRRTLYDDARGMGEGLVDNRKTVSKFWLLIEDINQDEFGKPHRSNENFQNDDPIRTFNIPLEPTESLKEEKYSRPSLYANSMSNLLNYPIGIFIVDPECCENLNRSIQLLNKPFGCDLHLLTLRTQPDSVYSQFPSSSAFLVMHRQGYDCEVSRERQCDIIKISDDTYFQHATVKKIEMKLLSGIESLEENIDKLSDISIEPMSLRTVNVTFI